MTLRPILKKKFETHYFYEIKEKKKLVNYLIIFIYLLKFEINIFFFIF